MVQLTLEPSFWFRVFCLSASHNICSSKQRMESELRRKYASKLYFSFIVVMVQPSGAENMPASPYLSSWVESWSITQRSSLFQYYIGKSFSTFFPIWNSYLIMSSREYVQVQKVLNANFGSSKIPNILVVSVFFLFIHYLFYFHFLFPVISVFLKDLFLQMKQTKRINDSGCSNTWKWEQKILNLSWF